MDNSPRIKDNAEQDLQIRFFPGPSNNEDEINSFLKTVIPISFKFDGDRLVAITYNEKPKKRDLSEMTPEELKKLEDDAIADTIFGFKDQHIQNNVANRFNIIKFSAEVELLKKKIESVDKELEEKEKSKERYNLEKEKKQLEKDLEAAQKGLDAANAAFESNQRHIGICDKFISEYVKK